MTDIEHTAADLIETAIVGSDRKRNHPSTYRKTTTRIIGKGTIVVARKKSKPLDPAEILRRAAEARAKERESRHYPGNWGLNEDSKKGDQGANVVHEAETRTKTARIYRYDAFGILFSRGALADNADEAAARLTAVRRFESAMAQRMRLEGTTGNGSGSSRTIPISDRSLSARDELDAIQAGMRPVLHGLLVKLVTPSVENGQPVNNWRKVVEDHTGEHRHVYQTSHVRACAEDLLGAWQAWDNRGRRAA